MAENHGAPEAGQLPRVFGRRHSSTTHWIQLTEHDYKTVHFPVNKTKIISGHIQYRELLLLIILFTTIYFI